MGADAGASAPAHEPGTSGKRPGQGKAARELNELIRYTMWSVYRVVPGAAEDERGRFTSVVAAAAEDDVVLRGAYDVGGLRGDADLMLWWHGPSAEALQDAYRAVGLLAGDRLVPVWSQMGLHRPAEFNRSHVPAFLAEEQPRAWVCVYPFVRSYEWYLLDEAERRAMLVEHGQMGRDYPDVRANTVAAFALGDYEWLLAFEADELHRIVDLMRHLRASTARRHVREETPFYTGRRITPEAVDALLA
jgi:chlorite dismutase